MRSKTKRVLIPLPSKDFDPTEAGVTWKILSDHGVDIVFSTPDGQPAAGDPRMITGNGLGVWSSLLKAEANGLASYFEMIRSKEFMNPLPYSKLNSSCFDGIVLPGGHAPGMKEYLESMALQNLTGEFMKSRKLVGAICHGVVLAARGLGENGKSILEGYKVTALLKTQELVAWALTYLWLGNYYRTYPQTVQEEVTQKIGSSNFFISGPMPLRRDSLRNLKLGFIVEDRNLITARWPGDAHRFATRLAQRLTDS